MRLAIFGGSFNPPHVGHTELLKSIQKRMNFEKIIIMPTYQNPLKSQSEEGGDIDPELRWKMCEIHFSDMGPEFELSRIEIARKGPSFTIDTIRSLKKELTEDLGINLILGADNLSRFDQWRDWKEILSECSLVVCSRPGWPLPFEPQDWPEFLKPFIKNQEFNEFLLITGQKIILVRIPEVPVSSSEIRSYFERGRSSHPALKLEVEQFINQNKIYSKLKKTRLSTEDLGNLIAKLLSDRKFFEVQAFDLRNQSDLTDFVIIASGNSTRHVSQTAEFIRDQIKNLHQFQPYSVEGEKTGTWVVMDYGDIMLHLFEAQTRRIYRLEELLSHYPQIHFDSK